MAKKKSHKKQSFKYAQPTTAAGATPVESPQVSPVKGFSDSRPKPEAAVISTTNSDNPYLGQDLARLGIIAGSLIALMFGLWFLFSNTSLGDTVYNLYKI